MSAASIEAATAHYQAGRLEEAGRDCEAILRTQPEHAGALNLQGMVVGSGGRHEQSIEYFEKAARLEPGNANYHANLGAALCRVDRRAEACVSCDAAIAIQPGHAPAWNNKANALLGLRRHDEALACADRAIAIKADFAEAHSNRGLALQSLARFEEALASFERAVELKPDVPTVRLFLAMSQLHLGDFESGWRSYEHRWQSEVFGEERRDFGRPRWLGKEDIAGKTILLHAEQGMGDTLQFVRYAQLVAARGARVILEVQPALAALLQGVAGADRVIRRGEPLPAFDFHCPLLSLPLAFDTRLDTIPADVPYVHAPLEAVSKWRERLGPAKGPRVGIAWSGNVEYKDDLNRSLSLAKVLPLQDAGIQLVSLQKEIRPSDQAAFDADGRMLHFGANFVDTAALISLMDVVISVDTSIAHLAGAMGEPVWVLVTDTPNWRWLKERSDNPWYPSARLFRQPKAGDWDSVLGAVRRALKGEIAAIAARGETQRLADEAEKEIRALNFAGAEKLLVRAASADARSGRVQYLLAVALHEQGKMDRAIACYRKAVRLEPAQAGLQRDFGMACAAKGRHADALACYEEALRQDPADERACTGAASACQALGDPARARAYFQRGLRLRVRRLLLAPFRLFAKR